MLKNRVFYKNDVSDKILMVLPRVSDKVLNNLKGLPLCELITFETTPLLVYLIHDFLLQSPVIYFSSGSPG